MTGKEKIMIDTVAVLTTLLECGPNNVPATPVYMALGCDWGRYERLMVLLATSGLITRPTQGTLSLTAKGIELAEKCNEALTTKEA